MSRSGRSWRQVEAEHRHAVGTLQRGLAQDFFLRCFLGLLRFSIIIFDEGVPAEEVPHNLFEHFPRDDKVFMVAPKIMIFTENLCFSCFFRARTL